MVDLERPTALGQLAGDVKVACIEAVSAGINDEDSLARTIAFDNGARSAGQVCERRPHSVRTGRHALNPNCHSARRGRLARPKSDPAAR